MKFASFLGEHYYTHRRMKYGAYTEIAGDVDETTADKLPKEVVLALNNALSPFNLKVNFVKMEVGKL